MKDNIFVEITKVNPATGTRMSKRERMFDNISDFKTYYELAKGEKDTYINIRFFDPLKDAKESTKYDYIIKNITNKGFVKMRGKE